MAKFLSSGGRLVLLNSVLSSLPIYMMSFFKIPADVLKKLNAIRSRFFWQEVVKRDIGWPGGILFVNPKS
jgi:hypothetical protein